jgi:hypothetical protein
MTAIGAFRVDTEAKFLGDEPLTSHSLAAAVCSELVNPLMHF